MYEFPGSEPITADVRVGAGALDIVAEARDTVRVEVTPYDDSDAARQAAADTTVRLAGDRLRVAAPEGVGWLFWRSNRIRVQIWLPLDSRFQIKTGSANVTCTGPYASGSVSGGSADISIEHVTSDLSVKTGSGEVTVGAVGGRFSCDFASGDARVGHVGGELLSHSASGNLDVGSADASVRATAASGEVRIGAARAGTVRVNTASGGVSVGVARGTKVWLDLFTAGRITTDLTMTDAVPPGTEAELTVRVRTASGDIQVHRAEALAAV
jgi:hypothetical protein